MTDIPQWAMEKARAIVDEMNVDWTGDGRVSDTYAREQRRLSIENIARALVEAEARGIERSQVALLMGYPRETFAFHAKTSTDECRHRRSLSEDCNECAAYYIGTLKEQDNG